MCTRKGKPDDALELNQQRVIAAGRRCQAVAAAQRQQVLANSTSAFVPAHHVVNSVLVRRCSALCRRRQRMATCHTSRCLRRSCCNSRCSGSSTSGCGRAYLRGPPAGSRTRGGTTAPAAKGLRISTLLSLERACCLQCVSGRWRLVWVCGWCGNIDAFRHPGRVFHCRAFDRGPGGRLHILSWQPLKMLDLPNYMSCRQSHAIAIFQPNVSARCTLPERNVVVESL